MAYFYFLTYSHCMNIHAWRFYACLVLSHQKGKSIPSSLGNLFLMPKSVISTTSVVSKWSNVLNNGSRRRQFCSVCLTICMRLFPPCEVMTRRSGLRLLTIWGLGGGGGDLARTTFPRLLPLETVSRPGEARALVYPLAAGGDRATRHKNTEAIKQVERGAARSGVF